MTETKEETKTNKIETTNNTLVPIERYLESGTHIGSQFRSGHMKKFIYKYRNDGLCVLDTSQIDNRIRVAAKFLSRYEPEEILIIAGRIYAQKPAKKLAETIGAKLIIKRFIPGTLTNPGNENFIEPKIILTADAPIDRQAIKEAIAAKIPVISLCDTSNLVKNIDLVIPANNKGKKSLALIYWLLAREYLKEKGLIKSDKDFTTEIKEFESRTESKPKEIPKFGYRSRGPMRGGFNRGGSGRR